MWYRNGTHSAWFRIIWCWKCLRQKLFLIYCPSLLSEDISVCIPEGHSKQNHRNTANKLFGPVFVYRKEHNIMGFFACLTKRITAFPKNGLFTISPVLLLHFTWLLCFLNRMKGWETISVCTGFGRLGLANQSWSLMLSLTFQASQMSWSMLGMDTTARLEDRLLIYVVENVQSCDRECHASAYFIKYV